MENAICKTVPVRVKNAALTDVRVYVENAGRKDQEENLGRKVVPVNVERLALRELQGHKGRKV